MKKNYQILDFDNDVLLFNKETYIISRFKELIHENFYQKFYSEVNRHSKIIEMFKTVSVGEACFRNEDITWQSSSKGINCQVFRVGSKGWQPGKLSIKVSIKIIPPLTHRESAKLNITVVLQFCPDEPTEPESPLDDIRKMMQAT